VGPLWRDWICSIDHKKIGIMYMVLGIVMLLRGFADAIMMRLHQADRLRRQRRLPAAAPLRPDLHGPRRDHDLLRGDAAGHRLMNYVVPLQIGARDVAFPFLNNFSFWMTAGGAGLVMLSLFIGDSRAPAGWPTRRCRACCRARTWGWTTTCGHCRWRA
jgi:cytochrome o ubiquinol oxidase subunit 1